MLIGLAFIVLGAIATAISGGSFMAAFVCGLTYAAKSAVSGAIMGAVLGCLTSAFRGENALEGLRQGFVDGFADGFMWGGITAGLSNVVKPGSFCFIAGTKVLTDHGHKNIEDIEVGDLVLAYDEETGETAYKPVVQLFRNTTKEWCTVSVRGNDGELYEITSTPGHKYFVPGNRVRKDSRALEHASYVGLSEKWVSACDLKRGDKVLLSDGTLCEVEGVSCKKLSAPETTYNLEIADFHTYYVSDACVLVHNRNCTNKYGRKGGPAHQKKIADLYDYYRSQGYTVETEQMVLTPGGHKSKRFADLMITKDNKAIYIQVGRATKGGLPVARERRALQDIMNAGKRVIFFAYNV